MRMLKQLEADHADLKIMYYGANARFNEFVDSANQEVLGGVNGVS